MRERQRILLERQQGESDLIYRRQAFYLATTSNVDVPEPQAVDDFLGVDLGVANLASDSDGRRYSGSEVKNVRCETGSCGLDCRPSKPVRPNGD